MNTNDSVSDKVVVVIMCVADDGRHVTSLPGAGEGERRESREGAHRRSTVECREGLELL